MSQGISFQAVEHNPDLLIQRLYFVLDAFDEVSQNEGLLKDWIVNTLRAYRHRLILSSRIGYSNLFEETQHNWLIAFNSPQQESLLSKYHSPESDAYQKLRTLAKKNQALATPLLLSMLCFLWDDKSELDAYDLQTQGSILNFCLKRLHGLNKLQKNWPEAKRLELKGHYQSLAKYLNIRIQTIEQEIQNFLAYIAFRMHSSGADLNQKRLKDWWDELRNLQKKSSAQQRMHLNMLDFDLSEAALYCVFCILSFLMMEIPGKRGEFRFFHQSFQEYLTALFLNTWLNHEEKKWFISTKLFYLKPHKKSPWVFKPIKPTTWCWDDIMPAYILNNEQIQLLKSSPYLRCAPEQLLAFSKVPMPSMMYLHMPNWKQVIVYLCGLDTKLLLEMCKGKLNRSNSILANIENDLALAVYATQELTYHHLNVLSEVQKQLEMYSLFEDRNFLEVFSSAKSEWAIERLGQNIKPRKNRNKFKEKDFKLSATDRRECVKAIGEIGSHQAIQALKIAVGDPSDSVRRETVRAFGKLDGFADVYELAKIFSTEYKFKVVLWKS